MIKVNDIWKPVTSGKILVNEAWRSVVSMKVAVDGVWRDMPFDEPQQTGIWYIEELDAIRNDLSGNHVLGRSLDFNNDDHYQNPANKSTYTTGSGWVPIGNSTTPFTGTLDGKGYTISNLFMRRTSQGDHGFFGMISASSAKVVVKDLNFLNADMHTYWGGILVGGVQGTGVIIEDCHVNGVIVGSSGSGGLVNWTNGSGHIFRKCSADVTITDTGSYSGGFVGWPINTTFEKCWSKGSVSNTAYYAGGFTSGGEDCIFNECYSNSSANSNTAYAAGFIATNFRCFLSRCYSTGAVTAGSNAAGFCALNSSGSVSYCFWDTQTSGRSTSILGDGRTTAQMQTLSNYTNWSIAAIASYVDETWKINDGVDYPRLGWE